MQLILPISSFLSEVNQSVNTKSLIEHMLRPFVETTLIKYIRLCLSFFQAAIDLGYQLASLTAVSVADILLSLQTADMDWKGLEAPVKSMSYYVKALRWLQKITQITFPNLYVPPISSFTFSDHQHRESMPLSLFLIAQWELDLVKAKDPLDLMLFKGAILCCIWASLRFSDASHVLFSSIIFDRAGMRALSWRTKTSKTGMPFGVYPFGVHYHADSSLSYGWLYHWLAAVDQVWHNTCISLQAKVVPDSLFVQLDAQNVIVGPLSYQQALKSLRFCISQTMGQLPFDHICNFTLHSAKSTMLSWAAQLLKPAETRACQGHHVYLQSVRLYSRDDVYPSLHLQSTVTSDIMGGWRPQTPQHRGGQLPLREPPVSVNCHPGSPCHHVWKLIGAPEAHSQCFQDVACLSHPKLEIEDTSSSPVSSSSSSVDSEASIASIPPTLSPVAPVDATDALAVPPKSTSRVLLFIHKTSICHVAVPDPTCAGSQLAGKHYKARCRVRCNASASIQDHILEGYRMCLKKACASTFDHYCWMESAKMFLPRVVAF